jgi:hypothetical protein
VPISRYIVIAVVRCFLGLLLIAPAAVKFAEAEVAVRDVWTHSAWLS